MRTSTLRQIKCPQRCSGQCGTSHLTGAAGVQCVLSGSDHTPGAARGRRLLADPAGNRSNGIASWLRRPDAKLSLCSRGTDIRACRCDRGSSFDNGLFRRVTFRCQWRDVRSGAVASSRLPDTFGELLERRSAPQVIAFRDDTSPKSCGKYLGSVSRSENLIRSGERRPRAEPSHNVEWAGITGVSRAGHLHAVDGLYAFSAAADAALLLAHARWQGSAAAGAR